jgi:hypothetical protein
MEKKIGYQLIIYEIPEPETALLNRYYTTDFFSDLKQILDSDGMVVLKATASSVHAGKMTATYASSIYKSLLIVFPIVRIALGEETIFFAGSDPATVRLNLSLLKSRYKERGIRLDYFNPSQFNEMLSSEKIRYVTEQLQKQKGIRENTDLRPVTYYLNLILWDSYSDSQLGWLFRRLYTYGQRILIPIIATFALAWIIFHTYKKNKFDISNYLYIMFATGLWSLTEMLTIIFLYQNHFGYIYSDIGILVGLFMFGLSLGSYFTSQVLIEKPQLNAPNALLKSEFLIAGIITLELLLLIPGLYGDKVIFIALILLCGIGTGVQYPLINKVLIEGGFTTGKTAGVIDSMDHLGAFLGAIATNIILIPLFGVVQALLILLILKAAGTIPLFINRS